MALRSIMASFGASVQDANGRLVLKSSQTLEAMKFVKALYKETMTDEIFGKWILPKMFAQAASGKVTPEDALDHGHKEVKQIYQAWRSKGKI